MGRPVSTGPFIGRAQVLAALVSCLSQHGTAWVTGMAGIGKTRLAAELTKAAPALWVEVGGIVEGSALDAAIAATAGLSEARPSPAGLAARCASLGVDLVVLDDVDGVADTARQWLEALRGRVRAVATSRTDLPAVWTVRVPPLSDDASGALFAARVPNDPVSGVPRVEDAVRIGASLGGHPLAIGLAAARLSVLSLAELDAELGPDLLHDPAGRGTHAGIDPLLRAATEGLSPAALAMLRAVVLVRAPFSRDRLGAVADLPPGQALDALQVLVGRHLVEARSGGDVQFAAHPLVNAWVEARTPPEEWRATARRFGAHLARDLERRVWAADPQEQWVFDQTAHVERLVALAQDGTADPSDAADAVIAHGRVHWRLDLPERVVDLPLDDLRRGRVLEMRGRILLARTDSAAMSRDAELAAAAAFDAAGHPGAAWAARGLAAAASLVLDRRDADAAAALDAAILHTTEARDLADLRRMRAVYAHAPNGRYVEAAEDKRAYLEWARASGRPWLLAQGLHSLAIALDALYRDEEARELLEQALALAREWPWRPLAGHLLNHLGSAALWSGRYDEAVSRSEESAEWLVRVGVDANAPFSRAIATLARVLRGEKPADPPPMNPGVSRRWGVMHPFTDVTRAAAALARGEEPAPVSTDHEPSIEAVRVWNEAAVLVVAARRAFADGDRARAKAVVAQIHALPPVPEGTAVGSFELYELARRVAAFLGDQVAARLDDWRYSPDGRWFESPRNGRVSLDSRPVLTRILARLARGPADLAGLAEAGWPGERMTDESRRNRVHVALSTLRKLGLDALETTEEGWVLHTSPP